MKIAVNRADLLVRLGVSAAALLLSQQVLALGTDAGTTVSNQATVGYSVSGNPQTPIESDPTGNSTPGAGNPTEFLVDRRVSFTLIEVDGAHTTPVAPDDTDVVTAFTLTNTGNAIMDFRLGALDFAGAVHGIADSTDLGNYRVRAANGDGAGGVPVLGDFDFVDELAEDAVVEIYVFADAPLTVLDGEFANIELTVTAADDADALPTIGTLDPDLAESPGADDPTIIESVFADAGNDGFEVAQDGYEIVSAALEITKTAAVDSDPFGSGKAVPGAIIEYTIVVDNTTGSTDATNVSIADVIDADVTFVDEAYGVGQDININGSFCNADALDADTDGCSLDGANLVIGDNVDLTINVAAGASYTVTFQVLIPNL
jgi:uncharacterized repeat protein (TIGR01451 family)